MFVKKMLMEERNSQSSVEERNSQSSVVNLA